MKKHFYRKSSRQLYIYDDFPMVKKTDPLSKNYNLAVKNLKYAIGKNPNIRWVNTNSEVCQLKSPRGYKPDLILALGKSGLKIANHISKQFLWKCELIEIPITRQEDSPGKYSIVPLPKKYLSFLENLKNIYVAIVDDTIYSGLTISYVLNNLPVFTAKKTQVFCVSAVRSSMSKLKKICNVTAGLIVSGNADEEVIIIRGSGLFLNGAIKRKDKLSLAFFERPSWIKTWFPVNSLRIINLCKRLQKIHAYTNFESDVPRPFFSLSLFSTF